MTLINKLIENRKHPLFSEGATLIFLSILVNVLSFVFQIFISRDGSIDDVGIFNLVNSLNYLTLVPFNAISASFGYLIAYSIGKYGKSAGLNIYRQARSNIMKTAIFVVVAWLAVTPFLTNYFHLHNFLPILSFVVVWIAGLFIVIDRSYLNGALKFGFIGVIGLVEIVSKLTGAYLILLWGKSEFLYLLIPVSTLFTLVTTYFAVKFVSKDEKAVDNKPADVTVKFPIGIFIATIISTISMTLYMSVDIILAKHFLTPTQAGQYSIVAVFGKITFFLGALVTQFIQPLVARARGSNTKYSTVLWISCLVTFLLCAVFISTYEIFGSGIVIVLLGQERGGFANMYLPLYLIGMTGFTMSRVFESFFSAAGIYSFAVLSLLLGFAQIIWTFYQHTDVSQFVTITSAMGVVSIFASFALFVFHMRKVIFTKLKFASNPILIKKISSLRVGFMSVIKPLNSTIITFALFTLFCLLVIAFSIRGVPGNPSEKDMNQGYWTVSGPMELSPERGRFALLYSLIENKSFQFSLPIARFAIPDLGYHNKKYVSLFAPGLSFIIVPGYLIGKYFGLSQVGTYSVIGVIGVINALLISVIVLSLKGKRPAALLAALSYLFATPSFAYSVSLYQHQATVLLILLSLFFIVKFPKRFFTHIAVWVLYGFGVSLDYPNLLIMMPFVVYLLYEIISVNRAAKTIRINIVYIIVVFSVIIPLIFFFWTNYSSYGNPLQLAGTVKQIGEIDAKGNPTEKPMDGKPKDFRDLEKLTRKKEASNFFATRSMLNGFYILLFSPDRGLLWYAPIVAIGMIGVFAIRKYSINISRLVLSVGLVNLLIYSMWGDPWGGWAFGARYLIPLYAMLSIAIGYLLSHMTKAWFWIPVFVLLFIYGVYINTAGALTTSLNPPQVEVLQLEKLSGSIQKYTFERNFDYLKNNRLKSFVYQTYLKPYLSGTQYHMIISLHIILLGLALILSLLPVNKFLKSGYKND